MAKSQQKYLAPPLADVRWEGWARAVAEYVAEKGYIETRPILRAEPGGTSPPRTRHCIAYLETSGVLRYIPPNGKPGRWTLTDYGRMWLRGGLIDGCSDVDDFV